MVHIGWRSLGLPTGRHQWAAARRAPRGDDAGAAGHAAATLDCRLAGRCERKEPPAAIWG
jgi:hypothetical protein